MTSRDIVTSTLKEVLFDIDKGQASAARYKVEKLLDTLQKPLDQYDVDDVYRAMINGHLTAGAIREATALELGVIYQSRYELLGEGLVERNGLGTSYRWSVAL